MDDEHDDDCEAYSEACACEDRRILRGLILAMEKEFESLRNILLQIKKEAKP